MQPHFTIFTPEAMRAFGQDLAAEAQGRREFIDKTAHHTFAMLAEFRRAHREAEARRRGRAVREAAGRRLFLSDLRSGVQTLRDRFEVGRREMAADFQEMVGELRAAGEAFRNRPGNRAGSFVRHAAQPGKAAHAEKPGHSKKRRG